MNGKHKLLYYVEDFNISGENLQTVRENTKILIKPSKNIGLEVNFGKTKQVLYTERGGSVVTHETPIREVPGSNAGADQPD